MRIRRDAAQVRAVSSCPTCATDLERFSRPLPEGGAVETEMCLDCGGLWLDDACLATTFPELLSGMRRLERREADEATRSCPACEMDMSGFILEGLALDACDRCLGVWVDSREIRPLDNARAAIVARGGLGAVGGYRTPSVPTADAVPIMSRACEGCRKPQPESRLADSNGRALCRVCLETETEPLAVPRTLLGHLLRLVRVIR